MKVSSLYLFFIALFCPLVASAQIPLNRSEVLYDSSGGPSKALLDVLKACNLSYELSWQSIIETTQANWLTHKNRFQLEAPELKLCPNKSYQLFSQLNMTQTIYPNCTSYQYAVILGSSLQLVCQSLNFLGDLWKRGTRFEKIVFLTGNRALDPNKENEAAFQSCVPLNSSEDLPKNEAEMMVFLYCHMNLPSQLRQLPLDIIDTPASNGIRPNTRDTFLKWVEEDPLPGSVLIFSSQPFVGRQDSIARHVLPPSFSIETIGKGFPLSTYKDTPFSQTLLLDELARWIFEEINGPYSY